MSAPTTDEPNGATEEPTVARRGDDGDALKARAALPAPGTPANAGLSVPPVHSSKYRVRSASK